MRQVTCRLRTYAFLTILFSMLSPIVFGLSYDEEAETRLQQRIQHRKPLSVFDKGAKERMLRFLPEGKTSGVLFSSPQLSIDYIRGPDVFQVEIRTTDLDRAKKQAVEWFIGQGFSRDAICNYPVVFYTSWDVKQSLRNS